MITIAAVDDHPLFLDGLRRILRRAKDVNLVAEGSSAEDAISIASQHKPDVMLLDITMPGGGLRAARSILSDNGAVRVIMLTASDDDEYLSEALAVGVKGYVVKAGSADDLLLAIASVRNGQTYISSEFATRLILSNSRRSDRFILKKSDFSEREAMILDLLVQGCTNKQIADELSLAVPTVKNALTIAFQKLRVHTRVQALLAWRNALRG